MAWTRQRITYTTGVAFVAANLVVGALLVSNSGVRVRQGAGTPPPPPPAPAPAPPAPPPPATSSPPPSPPAPRPSPSPGEPVSSLTPVLAVKIDNSALARPQ